MGAGKCAWLVAFVATVSWVMPASSQPAAAVFGVVLDQAFDRASQLLTQAESTGNYLEAQAAGRAQLLIESARRAYADSLTKTTSALSAQQQQVLSGIKTILDDASNNLIVSVGELVQRAQLVANAIPLSKTLPQAASVTGTLIEPGSSAGVVRVGGNFFDASKDGFTPVLMIGAERYLPTRSTTTMLEFALSGHKFVGLAAALSHVSAVLYVPYEERCHWVMHCTKKSTFTVRLDVLPVRPGSVTLSQSKSVDVRDERDFVSHEFFQDSSQDDKEQTHCDRPDGGAWFIVKDSVHYELTHEEGRKDHDWFDYGNQSSDSDACFRFKTLHKGFGTSGKLHLKLHYRAFRMVPTPQALPEQTAKLGWSDRHVLNVDPTATWKVVFHRFDGKDLEYASSIVTPFLKLESAGASLTIATPPWSH